MTANRKFNVICAAAVTSAFAAGLISAPSLAQEATPAAAEHQLASFVLLCFLRLACGRA